MPILSRYEDPHFERKLTWQIDWNAGLEHFAASIRNFLASKIEVVRYSKAEIQGSYESAMRGCSASKGRPRELWPGVLLHLEYLDLMARHGPKRLRQEAAEALALIADEAVSKLTKIGYEAPELLRTLAHDCDEWPSRISFHPDWDRENRRLIKAVELGKDSPLRKKLHLSKLPPEGNLQIYRATSHKFSYAIVEIVEAAQYFVGPRKEHSPNDGLVPTTEQKTQRRRRTRQTDFGAVVERAAQLPYLRPESAKDWFEIGWELLAAVFGGQPEIVPELGDIGRTSTRAKALFANEEKDPSELSRYRNDIRREVRKVFMRIFGPQKPKAPRKPKRKKRCLPTGR